MLCAQVIKVAECRYQLTTQTKQEIKEKDSRIKESLHLMNVEALGPLLNFE